MLKIALLGGSSFLGKKVLATCLKKDIEVKALVRSPEKIQDFAKQVEILEGDMFSYNSLKELIKDVDAVVSVAGPQPKYGKVTATPFEECMNTIVTLMKEQEIKRIINVSSAGMQLPDEKLAPKLRILRFFIRLYSKESVRVKELEMEILKNSGLEWTSFRPPWIKDNSGASKVLAHPSYLNSFTVDADLFAWYIVESISVKKWEGYAPLIANAKG